MNKSKDYAHAQVNEKLERLEKRIKKEYQKASKEVQEKLSDYLKQFEDEDKEMRAKVDRGDISEANYFRWRKEKILTTQKWEKQKEELVDIYSNADRVARGMMSESVAEAYALNRNYSTFIAEKKAKLDTSFTLYDKHTAMRLLKDKPKLLPKSSKKVTEAIREGKVKKWNDQKFQSAILQGILQGESMDDIAERLSKTVGELNMHSAVRNARTATTSAENAGRMDGLKEAHEKGIKVKKVWLATMDNRTRHEHVFLDGQRKDIDEPFEVYEDKIMFPGDPDAEPYLVYNCRCTLIEEVDGIDLDVADTSMRSNKLSNMTYEEWKAEHEVNDSGD
jgi:uncharacterized protein with gpF-like domain